MARGLRRFIKQVRNNPHIFCFHTCSIEACPKHKSKCPYDGQYLFALLKDTPYCPYEEVETYEHE